MFRIIYIKKLYFRKNVFIKLLYKFNNFIIKDLLKFVNYKKLSIKYKKKI